MSDAIVEGFSIVNPSSTVGSGGLISADLTYRCLLLNCNGVRPSAPGLLVTRSHYFTMRGGGFRDGLGQSIGGTGYGVIIGESSLFCSIEDCVFDNLRENAATNNARGTTWINCKAISPYDSGLTPTGQHQNTSFIGCETTAASFGFAVGFKTTRPTSM